MTLSRVFALLVFAAALSVTQPASAAPKKDLWQRWATHVPGSARTIDHGVWDGFLERHVRADPVGLNRVDYAGVTPADRQALEGYVAKLERTDISRFDRPEQLAYWINLYNALTVKVVLEHYPVASIRDIDISPGLFSSGPWGKKLVGVEGEMLSLDDIEHRILRPIWGDARIHYAVNCASVGCPDLLPRAFTPADMDAVLDANARAYINSPRGVKIDGGDIEVSSIYDWFAEDFGGSEQGVLSHLLLYAEGETKVALEKAKGVDGYFYDWSLNGVE